MDHVSDHQNRRDALIKLMRLGAIGAGSAGLGVWLNARSKRPEESRSITFQRRDSIRPDPNLPELVVAQGEDPRQLVRKALQELGGMGRFIARGDVVLVKPNIGWDRTPEQAANTNPQVVAEVVRLCREAGASRVVVTDVSCNDPRRCFGRSGIAQAAGAEGADVILPDDGTLRKVDKVINIPVAKNHSLSGVTLGMKNWLGIVGGVRSWLHQDIHTSVVDLAECVRPELTLIDAYRVLIRNGPTGGSLSDVEVRKTLIAATDPVAADAYAAQAFWGLDSSSLPYLKIAQDRGLGVVNPKQVRSRVVTVS
jgi:uncharacterized protein (DUF362 family)